MKRIIQIQADVNFINDLIELTDEKTASKAFLHAAEKHERLDAANHSNNEEIKRLRDQIYRYQQLIASIEKPYREIQELLGQGDLL